MKSTRGPHRCSRGARVQASLAALASAAPLLLLLGCGPNESRGAAPGSTLPPGTAADPRPANPTNEGASACDRAATQPGYRPVAPGGVPADALSAAQRDLPLFLASETSSPVCGLGGVDAGAAVLGTPYRLFGLCLPSDPGSTAGTATPADIWEFPVTVDGAYRCMLTVGRVDGRWQGTSLGAKLFAESLQAIESSHPSLSFSERGLVMAWIRGSCCGPWEFLGVRLADAEPSFLPVLRPLAESVARWLPRYDGWTDADPVPVVSWEELSRFARR